MSIYMQKLTVTIDPSVARLAKAVAARYLILERVTGQPLCQNGHGKATRWAFTYRATAIHNMTLAHRQIRPAMLYDAVTGDVFGYPSLTGK